jgi:hypothetical protein
MNTPRCESKISEHPKMFCPEPSTKLVSRIDASRDYRYACDRHAEQIVRYSASEASPLVREGSLIALDVILNMWPPKHRSASRDDAKAIVAQMEKAARCADCVEESHNHDPADE